MLLQSELDITETQLMTLEAKVRELSRFEAQPDPVKIREQEQALEFFNKQLSKITKEKSGKPPINRGKTEVSQATSTKELK